jgi:hypothetical protein
MALEFTMSIRPASLLIIAFIAVPAFAQLSRTAVSVQGNDLNSCAVAAPCRTLAVALGQTNAGGEIIVLDSGGFGTVAIYKSVSVIAAPGAYAGITMTAGGFGVFIHGGPTSTVVIRGLTINMIGTGTAIHVNSGSASLENLVVECGGGGSGITHGAGDVNVSDTVVRNCYDSVMSNIGGTGPRSFIDRVTVVNNRNGAFTSFNGARVTVRDSVASGGNGGFVAAGFTIATEINIENCVATRQQNAVTADNNGTVRISNSVVTDNVRGMWVMNSGIIETFGNNQIRGNTTDLIGTPTPVGQN